jgi:hypothetical protein
LSIFERMKRKLTLYLIALLAPLSWGFSQSTTFNYAGAQQIYVVPAFCVTSVQVDAYGAEGGGNGTAPGGAGGHTTATIPVTPGETLYVYVGGTGDVTGTAGYNGGGSGIGGSTGNPGSGGGGASDVRRGGTTLNDRWVVAGGGGGGTENGGVAFGGLGGGLTGGDANAGTNPWGCTPLVVATGGTQSAGGLGGTSGSCAWNGQDGSFGQGGNSYNNYRCAGGGGGWYGGGGAHNGTSGAGGSSYAHPSATNVTHLQGARTGNGLVVITADPGITVSLGPDTTLCSGGVLDAGNAGSTYAWNTGATTQTLSVTQSGTYDVLVTSPGGCLGRDTVTVSIAPGPIVNLGADTTICTTTTLDAGAGATSYAWSTGAITQTIVVGGGTYSVAVTNGAGCVSSDTVSISIYVGPTVELGTDTSGCDNLTLDAGIVGGTYVWSTGDTAQSINVSASGTYAVTVVDGSVCAFTSSDSIGVSIGSTTAASMVQLPFQVCNVDPPIALVGTPSGGVFGGPGVSGNLFEPGQVAAGPLTITYTYTDSVGCVSMDSSNLEVIICDGVGDQLPLGFTLYPNPNDGLFHIQGFTSATPIEVVNALGQSVYKAQAATGQITIDLSTQAKGIYFLRLWIEGKWYGSRVVVK